MNRTPPSRAPTMLDAIGATPVVQLRKIVPQGSADILVKLEYFNPTGSYKDRMAPAMIEEAEKRGELRSVHLPVFWVKYRISVPVR